ncbi:MAG: hypothetical protein M0Z28_10250 [Rhodospirillales bacterium]|nr:hypothetical protein [Rhodospirillales bacterium]
MTPVTPRDTCALAVQLVGIDRLLTALREAGAEAPDAGALHGRWERLQAERVRLARALAEAGDAVTMRGA